MTWFLVPVRCAGPSGPDVHEAFYDLDDDTTAVVSVAAGEAEPATGRQTAELALAIDAQDAGAATVCVHALFAADPDFELISLGEVTETTNPRALGAEALGILRVAARNLSSRMRRLALGFSESVPRCRAC